MHLRLVAPQENIGAFIELELLASATYVDFVYGDVEIGRRIHTRLLAQNIGEFAHPDGGLAVDPSGAVVGMLAGPLSAKTLARARLRSAAALLKDPDFASNVEFRTRATAARDAFISLREGDAYLSRIAVATGARRRGIGRALLALFLDKSRSQGAQRAVLEVSPQYHEAIRMYRSAGFDEIGDVRVETAGRSFRYLQLAAKIDSTHLKP